MRRQSHKIEKKSVIKKKYKIELLYVTKDSAKDIKKKKRYPPSLHIFRFSAPEALLVVHGARFALTLLWYYTVLADVELGAIVRMWIRGMRKDPAGRTSDIAVRTYETVVQDVTFHVFAQANGVRRPDAARHLGFVDQSRWTGHHLHHPVDAVDETIARGRVLVAEDAVRAWAPLAKMRLLYSITNTLLHNINA